jgi:hypothetical protein
MAFRMDMKASQLSRMIALRENPHRRPQKMSNKDKFPHYHMCEDCGKEKGGNLDGVGCITVIKGICKYCEWPQEQVLIPWIDFNWPKDKATDKFAKLNRD